MHGRDEKCKVLVGEPEGRMGETTWNKLT
jgi:hypothetical protein